MNRNDSELCAAGALSNILGEEGISIADTLARLSDEDYKTALAAIDLFRAAHRPRIAPSPVTTTTPDGATLH